jgi:hypothetical protein
VIPASPFGDPELFVEVPVLSGLLLLDPELLRDFLGLLLEAIVRALEEQQPENVVLVVRRVDTPAELVRGRPQMIFESLERERVRFRSRQSRLVAVSHTPAITP